MKTKIRACENQEFIPQEVRESDESRLDTAQLNLLGTLCFYHLNYSIHVAQNNGWFFKDQQTLFSESNLSPAEGKRTMLKLVLKKLVERIPGTNHKCTAYRLCKDIRDLMPTEEIDLEEMANEPLDKNSIGPGPDIDTGPVTGPVSGPILDKDQIQVQLQDQILDKNSSSIGKNETTISEYQVYG